MYLKKYLNNYLMENGNNVEEKKHCIRCKNFLIIKQFTNNYNKVLKTCQECRAKTIKNPINDRETIKQNKKNYYAKHKECMKEASRNRYKKFREEIKNYSSKYYKDNIEICKSKKRNYYFKNKKAINYASKKYRDKNKESIKETKRLYRNKDINKLKIIKNDAIRRNIVWDINMTDELCIKLFNSKCYYCGVEPLENLNGIDLSLIHI
jgi:hypothetical protein